ncbi:MAG: DUF4282 domain-containing protein [Rhodothermus sp.]|nr:DUF4282 domain-containing protein [Rhodothermus sp.]
METRKGFLAALFDFSFSEFITARLIRLLYALMLIMVGVFVFVWIIGGFAEGFEIGVLSLVLSPLVFLLSAIVVRIYLELVMIIFRIAEYLRQLVALVARRDKETPMEPPL